MKRIILLHTVQTMYLKFEKRVRDAISEEVRIDNMLDTFFSSDPNEIGYFSKDNLNRLYHILKAAELARPNVIAVVCSSLSPYVRQLEALFDTPILQIDSRLGPKVISVGTNIQILASTISPIAPTRYLVERAAQEAGVEVDIDAIYDMKAFHGMMSGDMETHDNVMLELAGTIKNKDVIVFAQGSLEHLAGEITKITNIPVVTAPALLVEDIKRVIGY